MTRILATCASSFSALGATLTIKTDGLLNYTIWNSSGTVHFSVGTGGTTITMANITSFKVLDQAENTVFSTPDATSHWVLDQRTGS